MLYVFIVAVGAFCLFASLRINGLEARIKELETDLRDCENDISTLDVENQFALDNIQSDLTVVETKFDNKFEDLETKLGQSCLE